jgi:hypothetical protein
MNRELLEKPFPPEAIKQREGNFGKTLDYIEGHAVIQRLNDALDGMWSFEITEHKILEPDEVLVLGKLTADNIVKMQFGSSKITRAKETGNIISLADDLKASATDALKKCATQLGVGLHLYAAKGDNGNKQQPAQNKNGNGNGRLSSKQHQYILKLGQEQGLTKTELNKQCKEKFGSVVDFISKADASSLINELMAA